MSISMAMTPTLRQPLFRRTALRDCCRWRMPTKLAEYRSLQRVAPHRRSARPPPRSHAPRQRHRAGLAHRLSSSRARPARPLRQSHAYSPTQHANAVRNSRSCERALWHPAAEPRARLANPHAKAAPSARLPTQARHGRSYALSAPRTPRCPCRRRCRASRGLCSCRGVATHKAASSVRVRR